MITVLATAALVLAGCLLLGLVQVLRGPALEERMMAVQLMGTTGVALLLVLDPLLGIPASEDVALVLALLAAVAMAALTRREQHGPGRDPGQAP